MNKIPDFPSFKKLELADKKKLEIVTRKFEPFSDYNFTSLYSYNIREEIQISKLNGNLVVRFSDYITSEPVYSFIGNQEIKDTINKLLEFSKRAGLIPKLKLIPQIDPLDSKLLKHFLIEEDRDNFDYIYSTKEISILNGKKFEKKRNKINKFLRNNPDANPKLLDLQNPKTHRQIYEVFSLWEKNKGKDKTETEHELIAIKRLLSAIKSLKVICLGIYINGVLKGFSITESLFKNYGIFHFAKADPQITGIFEFIYLQTAKEHLKRGSLYLSREQDLGIEGLRAAKESWRPIKFLKKYTISPKG